MAQKNCRRARVLPAPPIDMRARMHIHAGEKLPALALAKRLAQALAPRGSGTSEDEPCKRFVFLSPQGPD